MSGRLSGKNAIITGASSGIGRATALIFAHEGARVVLADLNETYLTQVRDEIIAKGGSAIIKKTDVAVEDEVKNLLLIFVREGTDTCSDEGSIKFHDSS